jgi:RecB family exonuclease
MPQPRRRGSFDLPAELAEPAVRAREDQVAEERRLLYVAMTRARSRLYLSWADRYEGNRKWKASRFLRELNQAGSAVAAREFLTRVENLGTASEAAGAAEIVDLSYSAIASYRECPRQFHFRYVQKLPAASSLEARYGAVIHAVLMEAGRVAHAGQRVTETLLEQLLEDAWSGLALGDRRREQPLRRLASRQLRQFIADGGFETAPALVEHPFTLDLDGVRLHGVIDRVDTDGTTWKLVDYKTGSELPAAGLRRDLQLALYGLAAQRSLGWEPVKLEIVYLRNGERVELEPDGELLEGAERVVGEVAHGLLRRDYTARPERRRCRGCPYRLPCVSAL